MLGQLQATPILLLVSRASSAHLFPPWVISKQCLFCDCRRGALVEGQGCHLFLQGHHLEQLVSGVSKEEEVSARLQARMQHCQAKQ